MRPLFPKYVSTLQEVGQAMINAVRHGYSKRVLEVPDIVALAKAKGLARPAVGGKSA